MGSQIALQCSASARIPQCAQTHTHTPTCTRENKLGNYERGAFYSILLCFPELKSGSEIYLSLPVSLPPCNSGKLVCLAAFIQLGFGIGMGGPGSSSSRASDGDG